MKISRIRNTKLSLRLHSVLSLFILSVIFTGCGSGEIANLGGIAVDTDYYYHRYIIVEITLKSSKGYSLLWEESILNPQVGADVVPEEDFETNVKIYSLSNGVENKKVYDGKLADLHWNRMVANTPRILIGKVPTILIKDDPQRDTELGNIEVTLITPAQGSFTDKVEGVKIYAN